MKIVSTMITCPARDELCAQSLASLAASDWGEIPFILRDDESGSSERTRVYTLRALEWFLRETDADILLFLEDDILLNVHLRWNVEHWEPLLDGSLWLGTLYSPRQPDKDDGYSDGSRWRGKGKNYALGTGAYGAQAFVISRPGAEIITRGWAQAGTPEHPPDRCPSDFKMVFPIAGAGHYVHYHVPSLVQHVGILSIWNTSGMVFHEAWDFDPNWRAE